MPSLSPLSSLGVCVKSWTIADELTTSTEVNHQRCWKSHVALHVLFTTDRFSATRSYTFSRRKLPFCFSYLEIKCPDPGIPDNGQRSGSLFYEGTQVRFSCDDGFELDGLRSLECVRLCYSCSSVRWNGTTPTCRRIGKYFCPTSDVFPLCHWSFLYIKVLTLASCIRWSDLVNSGWVGLSRLVFKAFAVTHSSYMSEVMRRTTLLRPRDPKRIVREDKWGPGSSQENRIYIVIIQIKVSEDASSAWCC